MRQFTAEYERNLRREHKRLHPDGLFPKAGFCETCLLLAVVDDTRAVVAHAHELLAKADAARFEAERERNHYKKLAFERLQRVAGLEQDLEHQSERRSYWRNRAEAAESLEAPVEAT